MKKILYVGLTGLCFLFVGSIWAGEKGLVTHFAFNEGKGDVVFDHLGRKGVIHGAKWVQGKFGSALSFNGEDTYVEVNGIEGLDGNNEITVEAWIKPDSLGSQKSAPVFLSHGKHKEGGWYIYIDRFKRVIAVFSKSRTVDVLATKPKVVSVGKWAHVAVTAVKNGKWRIYVNGIECGSKTMSLDWAPFPHPLYIGKYSEPGFEFSGIVDEVKIYNHALTAEEVKVLYRGIGVNLTDNLAKRIQSLDSSLEGKWWKQEIKMDLNSLREKANSPDVSTSEIISGVSKLDSVLDILESGKVKTERFLIYKVNPITNEYILPDTIPIPGEISNTIPIIACPNEYEPASFVIQAFSDINSLKVEATKLKGKKSFIPRENINIRVVKCWYNAVGDRDKATHLYRKVLVPQLLIKDDSLVKVDMKKQENYLKLTYEKEEKYAWISWQGVGSHKEKSLYDFSKWLPVYDSAYLQPVDIPKYTNKQFWITIKVPEDAKPGLYIGKINLSTPKEVLGSLTLKLNVLPFEFSEPYYTSSIYNGNIFDTSGKGTLSFKKSQLQFKREMENLFAHGVTNPSIFSYGSLHDFDEKELAKMLEIRKEAGMSNKILYTIQYATGCGWKDSGCPSTPDALESLKEDVRKYINFCKPYGTEEVYFYGVDEAIAERLEAQRPAWEAIHEAGGKIWLAGYMEGHKRVKGAKSNFELMGDIQDLLNCAHWPSKEEAKRWHSVGHKIWSYANPQSGRVKPETYRRNFGLLLWQNDYDGAATYAYQAYGGNQWNNFDYKGLQESFTYPTADGVVDTTPWEGYREGVDDVRYLTTLVKTIEKAKESEDKKVRDEVLSAQEYLGKLKAANLATRDLDTVRLEIIAYILKLTGGQ